MRKFCLEYYEARHILLDRFDYYDAVAHVIPGAVACLFMLYVLDIVGVPLPKISEGSFAQVGIGIVVSYVVGHLLQAVASTVEPFYYATWGGKPSINLLEVQSKTFSDAQRNRLIGDISSYFKVSEILPEDKKGKRRFYQRLFERCMALCNREKLGRVDRFEVSYSFHRVLLTTFALFFLFTLTLKLLICGKWLSIQSDKSVLLIFLICATAVGTAIEFFRARKRAYYYAREVLWMTADHIR